MKLLNSFETLQISGGTIMTFAGLPVYVDTTGIPAHCVSGAESIYNAGLAEIRNNPYATEYSVQKAITPYAEAYTQAGCDPYRDTLISRINAAIA